MMAARFGPLESAVQVAVIAWAKTMRGRHPELRALHAVPNFSHIPRSGAGASWMVKRMAEGMEPGVPDLDLPVARGGYIGLRIEMKRIITHINKKAPPRQERTKTSAAQDEWIKLLRSLGHRVVVCWTAEEAQKEILTYLRLPPTLSTIPEP